MHYENFNCIFLHSWYSTPTKAPGMLIQSSGRVFLLFKVLLQVLRTKFFLVAKDPYLLLVDVQSRVSLAFILVIQLALTSSLVGQVSSVKWMQTLWFLRCHISIVDSAIRILYRQLSLGLGFPLGVLKFTSDAAYVIHSWPGSRVPLLPYFFC